MHVPVSWICMRLNMRLLFSWSWQQNNINISQLVVIHNSCDISPCHKFLGSLFLKTILRQCVFCNFNISKERSPPHMFFSAQYICFISDFQHCSVLVFFSFYTSSQWWDITSWGLGWWWHKKNRLQEYKWDHGTVIAARAGKDSMSWMASYIVKHENNFNIL